MTALGVKLQVIRGSRGLTKLEASKQLGIARQTLSNIEKGIVDPTVETLSKISAGYGVPLQDLIEAKDAEHDRTGPVG